MVESRKIVAISGLLLFGAICVYYFYPDKKLESGIQIDAIEVYKSRREMRVYSNGQFLKKYKVALGKNSIGAKQFEGDCKTPEGFYRINDRNPKSGYHKNLGVSYPNRHDILVSTQFGKPTGGDIKIHGLRNGAGNIGKFHRFNDWTAGCIAVTNSEMDELYEHVKHNAAIAIYP